MAERCPTCGSPVEVFSGNEGTNHYEPLNALRESVEALEITLEMLERCRRDESLTYEEKKATEDFAKAALIRIRSLLPEEEK